MTTPGRNPSETLETDNVSGEYQNQSGNDRYRSTSNIHRTQNPVRPALHLRSTPYYPIQHSHPARRTGMPATHHHSAYNQPNTAVHMHSPHGNRPVIMERPAAHQYSTGYNQRYYAPHIPSSRSNIPVMVSPATDQQYYAYNLPHSGQQYDSLSSNSVRTGHGFQMVTPATTHHQHYIHNQPSFPSQYPRMEAPGRYPIDPAAHHHSPHHSPAGWNSLNMPVQQGYPNYYYNQTMHGSIPNRPGMNTQHAYRSSRTAHPQQHINPRSQTITHLSGGNVHKKYRNQGQSRSDIHPGLLAEYNPGLNSSRSVRFRENVNTTYYQPENIPSEYEFNAWRRQREYGFNGHDHVIEEDIHFIPSDLEGEERKTGTGGHCEICDLRLEVRPPVQGEQQSSSYSSSSILIYPEVSVLPCGHAFHSECFERVVGQDAVLMANPLCPTCPPKEEEEEDEEPKVSDPQEGESSEPATWPTKVEKDEEKVSEHEGESSEPATRHPKEGEEEEVSDITQGIQSLDITKSGSTTE